MSSKKVCEHCKEEVSRSAFYRRHRDGACREDHNATSSESYDSDLESIDVARSSEATDSSFCLDDDELENGDHDDISIDDYSMNVPCDSPADVDDEIDLVTSSSESELPFSDNDEIWDFSDSESDENQEESSIDGNTLIRGISYFLGLFHLTFRLSEKAMVALLAFLRTIFAYLASLRPQLSLLNELACKLPRSLYGIRKYFKHKDEYIVYVVCPRCKKLYHLHDCITNVLGQQETKLCDHVEFPHHRHSNQRAPCNTPLMKRVKIGGKFKLVPRKTFVYRSIIKALQMIIDRGNFLEACEHWRKRKTELGSLSDVYDGKVWKDLNTVSGRPFLSLPGNLCFTLNIDWFNPFDEAPYSAGAIYLVVLNLPRSEQYKIENTILVGMIPGPNEPKNHINTYLSPMVQDMCKLFEGHVFHNSHSLTRLSMVRAMLVCITCDLPATRKVCGFSNFNACHGCSKCLKRFPVNQFGKKTDYSGYDYENWPIRDLKFHSLKATESKNANTKQAQEEIAKEFGIKYSELILLPHFDIVRYHVIDPMHNIFLGLVKHTVKIWKDIGLLQDKHYPIIQEKVDNMNPPSKIGRIPRKIGSGFAAFTADEWKHWIMIYSLYALLEILPEDHYCLWKLLVDCCLCLCQPIMTLQSADHAHKLIVQYCKMFETLYGCEHCTPNMHMACHLSDSIKDYGPLSSFWCFPFERYNGILEGIKKSWLEPEKQMFLKYLDMQLMRQGVHFGEQSTFVSELCKEHMMGHSYSKPERSSSFAQTGSPDEVIIEQLKNVSCLVAKIDATKKSFHVLVPPAKEQCFTDTELATLKQMYSLLYPTSNLILSRFYHQYKKLLINEEEFLCDASLSKRSSTIAAKWAGVLSVDPRGEAPMRVGQVHSYIEHNITLIKDNKASSLPHVLARVSWYMEHPQRDYLHSTIIICSSTFDSTTSASFIPVNRIAGRCAIATVMMKFSYGEDRVNIVVPLLKNVPLL